MNLNIYDTIKDALFSTEVTTWSAVVKLVVSFLLGAIIGVERQLRRRNAGIRTFSLICMGSTAAMLVSIWIPQSFPDFLNGDPGRIAAQILTGIGFLGAGAIIQSRGSVHGLTTAAAIWVAAIIGMCLGCGMYVLACILTILSIFVLMALDRLERKHTLSGDLKMLQIFFSDESPEIAAVEEKIRKRKIYIYNISVEKDYQAHTSMLSFRIQIDPGNTLDDLFDDLRTLEHIIRINLEIL